MVLTHSSPTSPHAWLPVRDRKSTRLNSSHLVISYAVFCLNKKTHVAAVRDQRLTLTRIRQYRPRSRWPSSSFSTQTLSTPSPTSTHTAHRTTSVPLTVPNH